MLDVDDAYYNDMTDDDARFCATVHHNLNNDLTHDELTHLAVCFLLEIDPNQEVLQKARHSAKF